MFLIDLILIQRPPINELTPKPLLLQHYHAPCYLTLRRPLRRIQPTNTI